MNTGDTFPSLGQNINAGYGNWTSVMDITEGSGDANTDLEKYDFTDYLRATQYGFSIPTGATITGIYCLARCEAYYNFEVTDEEVQLVHNGSVISGCQNKADSSDWPDSVDSRIYGGDVDLWGCALTPAIVNSSTFGWQIMAASGQYPSTARVYSMRITVYYEVPSAPDGVAKVRAVSASSIAKIRGVSIADIAKLRGIG